MPAVIVYDSILKFAYKRSVRGPGQKFLDKKLKATQILSDILLSFFKPLNMIEMYVLKEYVKL